MIDPGKLRNAIKNAEDYMLQHPDERSQWQEMGTFLTCVDLELFIAAAKEALMTPLERADLAGITDYMLEGYDEKERRKVPRFPPKSGLSS